MAEKVCCTQTARVHLYLLVPINIRKVANLLNKLILAKCKNCKQQVQICANAKAKQNRKPISCVTTTYFSTLGKNKNNKQTQEAFIFFWNRTRTSRNNAFDHDYYHKSTTTTTDTTWLSFLSSPLYYLGTNRPNHQIQLFRCWWILKEPQLVSDQVLQGSCWTRLESIC